MKIKKIIALCKSQKTFQIFDQRENENTVYQWLSDGNAMYQISGTSYLDKENICALFDITYKQQGDYFFQHTSVPEGIKVNDIDPFEIILERSKISVICGGKILLPLQSKDGILFIQDKYLAPLEDIGKSIELYERKTAQGKPYIAVKAGLMIQAVIFPFDVIRENFVSDLEILTHECKKVLENSQNAPSETNNSAQESIFQKDPKTGEIIIKRLEDTP